jgi:hypothetical protein
MAEGRVRGFSIATRCATLDELIEKFRDRVDDESILVSTIESRAVGTECAFAILLADKQVALAGTCVVRDVFADVNNPFKRPGMRLAIKKLGPESQKVWLALLGKRLDAMPPLARAPRATPTKQESAAAQRELNTPRPTRTTPPRETRTPGSPFILPANPFTNLSDASLDGFVDCGLFEPEATPTPVIAAVPVERKSEPSLEMALAARPVIERAPLADAVVRVPIEWQRSEPLPLPPPPKSPRPDGTPYAATKLPDLNVPDANDDVRPPLIKRRLRKRLLVAVLLVPLAGAAAMVGYQELVAAAAELTAPSTPATFATVEPSTMLTAQVEPAPPPGPETEQPEVPATPQPVHAVLVRSWPIAATVRVGDRSFGSTPTYVKIPANTPVELVIARPGFKPVTYSLVSKTATDRVFVRLERARRTR